MKYLLEMDVQNTSYIILKQGDMRIFIYPDDIRSVCNLLLGIEVKECSSINFDKFDKFWAAYPKKASKQVARKSWEKINPSDELIEVMLMAVEEQSCTPQWQKDGGTYIPMPSTWLNQMKWEDTILVPIKTTEIKNEW